MIKPFLSKGFLASFIFLSIISPSLSNEDHEKAKQLVESGQILPLGEIMEKIKGFQSERILETELKKKRGQWIYEIEILDKKGMVWELKFNAKTGELIKTEREY